MDKENGNFLELIEIDASQLDVEWLEQAERFALFAEEEARLARNVAVAEERLARIRAELSLEIRSDPESYDAPVGSRGITEATLEATITLQPEYREAKDGLIEVRFAHAKARAAVKAFEHRKSALERLVSLHGQEYFAGPVTPRNMTAEDVKEIRNQSRTRRIQERRRKLRQEKQGEY